MAGFAVVMTIFTVGIFAIAAACVLSLSLYLIAKKKVRNESGSHRALTATCAVAPFVGLLWLAVALLLHVKISNNLAHQDCGLSGDPYVTLPNGYELGSRNTYNGYIQAPGFQANGPDVAGPGYVRSIVDLKFDNGSFVGTQFDFNTSSLRRFTLDTRTHAFESSPIGPVSWDAANDLAQRGPNSYWKLYSQYRHHWPNYVLFFLIVGGELAVGYRVWRVWTAFGKSS